MPDLNQEALLQSERGETPETITELTYALAECLDLFLLANGASDGSLISAIGALECAKLELHQRLGAV